MLFARRPVPGRVKTRLSPALPPQMACELYRAMLTDALDLLAATDSARRVVLWADELAEACGPTIPADVEQAQQAGRNLGERLESAFDAVFEQERLAEVLNTGPNRATASPDRGPATRAIAIGVDCPRLDRKYIEQAFVALDRVDVVLGPATDGGYTLIGLRAPAPLLFRAIDWGTRRVLEQTRERARSAGLAIRLLEPLADLDTPADLVRAIARFATDPDIAPRTRAALGRLGLLPAISPRPRATAAP
jgi:uncharacterized protein